MVEGPAEIQARAAAGRLRGHVEDRGGGEGIYRDGGAVRAGNEDAGHVAVAHLEVDQRGAVSDSGKVTRMNGPSGDGSTAESFRTTCAAHRHTSLFLHDISSIICCLAANIMLTKGLKGTGGACGDTPRCQVLLITGEVASRTGPEPR